MQSTSDSIIDQITKAESLLENRQFQLAGESFEQVGEQLQDAAHQVVILTSAGYAYQEARSTTDALRCYARACSLADPAQKAELLIAIWALHINEIAGCLYNCSFEWKGNTDGSHDSDHEYYQDRVRELSNQAEQALIEALSINGIGRFRVKKAAKRVCKDCESEGWGADVCWQIIAKVRRQRVWWLPF